MSDAELRKLEADLLAWIAEREPVAHDDVLSWAQEASKHYSPVLVRQVVWRLISESKLDFSPDWRLVVAR